MRAEKATRNQQSVETLEGGKRHLKSADLQAALGVASAATANTWADEYSRMSERAVRRNARGARVFEVWQIEEISQAYGLLASQAVSTRTEALTQILAAQRKSTANNRLTAKKLEDSSSAADAGDSRTEIVRRFEFQENRIEQTESCLEPTVVLVAFPATSLDQEPLSRKIRWGLLKTRVIRMRAYQWILQCFSFGHSAHWKSLTRIQRYVWVRRVGRFNNIVLAFGTAALIAFGIINFILWGLGFWVKVVSIPYSPVIWTVIVCTLVIPTVLFFLFPQN